MVEFFLTCDVRHALMTAEFCYAQRPVMAASLEVPCGVLSQKNRNKRLGDVCSRSGMRENNVMRENDVGSSRFPEHERTKYEHTAGQRCLALDEKRGSCIDPHPRGYLVPLADGNSQED